MSDIETHMGRLTECISPLNAYDSIKRLIEMGDINGKYFDDFGYDDYYLDWRSGYTVVRGKLYKISNHRTNNYGDVCLGSKNIDGSVDFALSFYNGGTCFSEMIGLAMEGIQ